MSEPATPDEILERTQWDFFWIPPDAVAVDRPELACLSCPRDVGMLNTVTRTRAAPERLPALVAEVGERHRAVTSRWLVPATFDTRPLERILDDGGWRPAHEHFAFTLPVESSSPRPASGVRVEPVRDLRTLRDCIEVAERAFGDARQPTDAQLAQELAAVTRPGARVHRFVAYDRDGRPVGSGGMSLFPALSFGLLFAGATIPGARGRGFYSAVLAARIETARALGFARVGLYARRESSAPIVARQGFERHGPMTYWDRPARAPGPR